MRKRTMAWILAWLMIAGALNTCAAEPADSGNQTALVSEYWTEDSPAAASLNDYLTAVTDAVSPDYIPEEDRIAVFDLDGTLMCETYPFCFEYMLFADYALNSGSDTITDEVRSVAQEIVDAAGGEKPGGMSTRQAAAGAIAYRGMTMDQLAQIVRDFKDSEAWGFTGMKRGEAYYRPMVELFDALLANDFTVYIVTATERNIVRTVIEGTLDIPPSHVIGTEYGYTATNQGDEADTDYTFQSSDQVVFDGNYYGENAKMSKVDAIVREIGKQPVLAFGNSSGDLAMEVYTISNNPYRSAAYMVVADDEAREYGNAVSAAQKKADYEAQGISVISMRDDFATIYGDGVAKAGAQNAQGDPLEAILSGMSLRDKIAQMMIASFRVWQEVPPEGEDMPEEEPPKENITQLNDAIRDMVSRNHFGGILLFGQNIVDAEQTLRLIADFQATNQSDGGLPQIVFTDQEGGNVNRIPYGTQGVSNMALGATGEAENARAMAAIFGEELGLLGIQADFAPVVDVNNNPTNPVIGIRSFSDDPRTVAAFGSAFIQGLHDAGILSTAKHFPGHGDTDTDSHTGAPVIDKTYEELKECELIPFRAAIDAGTDMIMTAHIQYPQIETGTYTSISTGESINLPATMSKTILTDILRGDLGFDGVVVTDALDMSAIADHFAVEDTVKLTIDAGVDMLILPAVMDTNVFRRVQTYVDTAVKLVEGGEIDEKRIDESVLRILKLKRKYGILDLTDFSVTEEAIAAAQAGVGSAAHREAEWEMAEKALTVYKNENGAFPLDVKAGEKTLILFADSCASRVGAGDLARRLLEERQALPEGAEIAVMKSTADNEEECIQAAVAADHVILVHRVYSLACLNPETDDGFSSGTFDRIIPAVHEAGKTVIVVSCQLPYDATRFTDADAVLLTWWGSAMRELPAEGACWSANLPAGLLACFGVCPAQGVAPVELPALNDLYMPVKQ